jgi:hypothetical protein
VDNFGIDNEVTHKNYLLAFMDAYSEGDALQHAARCEIRRLRARIQELETKIELEGGTTPARAKRGEATNKEK